MNNLSSILSQGHWSSTDINIIIPLSTVGGQDAHIWKRGEREAWRALRCRDGELDMAERLNYIGKPENSRASRLLEWSVCLGLKHTHTHSLLACLPFLFPFSPLHASLLHAFFTLKHLFFSNPSVIHATFTSFILSLFVYTSLCPHSSHCFHLCVPHLLAFSVTSNVFHQYWLNTQ